MNVLAGTEEDDVSDHENQPKGTADKILDFFLRRKRVLAKYTKEEKQKAIDLYIRYMEEDKLGSFPNALLDSPAGLLIEEHIGMLDERIDVIDEIEAELESSFTGI